MRSKIEKNASGVPPAAFPSSYDDVGAMQGSVKVIGGDAALLAVTATTRRRHDDVIDSFSYLSITRRQSWPMVIRIYEYCIHLCLSRLVRMTIRTLNYKNYSGCFSLKRKKNGK